MGRKDLKLMTRGWPPPWNRMSGLWYQKLPGVCDSAIPKLFAFDYCAIPRWYGEVRCRWNSDISETAILDASIAWLDMEDDIKTRRFENYHIPAVDEPRPMKVPKYRDRIREVKGSVDQGLKVVPFTQAHMPDDMWRETVSMLGEEADQGIWIQMYAYLSETKFRILREIFAGSKR